MIEKLNKLLSDLNVFYRKLQNYHWNVKGHDFFTIHAKLEEYYNEVNEQIDEIAEHILILNGQPLGTMKDYINTSDIEEAKNEKITSQEIFTEVIKDLEKLLEDVKKIKKCADENEDYPTSSLMDEYIENYGKKLWMLKQMKQ